MLYSIDDFSGGALDAYVIGVNIPDVIARLGVGVDRAVEVLSETHDIVSAIMAEGEVNHRGAVVEVDAWKLRHEFDREIPLYPAAMGPKMRELAAFKYDGLFLPVTTPVAFAEHAVNDVEAHLESFGRDPSEFTFSLIV